MTGINLELVNSPRPIQSGSRWKPESRVDKSRKPGEDLRWKRSRSCLCFRLWTRSLATDSSAMAEEVDDAMKDLPAATGVHARHLHAPCVWCWGTRCCEEMSMVHGDSAGNNHDVARSVYDALNNHDWLHLFVGHLFVYVLYICYFLNTCMCVCTSVSDCENSSTWILV